MLDIIPSSLISDEYGPALEDETLKDVAQNLANIERDVIELVRKNQSNIASALSSSSRGGPGAVFLSQKDIDDLDNLKKQFAYVYNGGPYHKDYLVDKHLLRYWNEAIQIVRSQLSGPVGPDHPSRDLRDTVDTVQGIARKAKGMESSLYSASRACTLTARMRTAIGDKWLRIKDLVGILNEKTGGAWSVKDWYFSSRSCA